MPSKHIPKNQLVPYSPNTFHNFELTNEEEILLKKSDNFLIKEYLDSDEKRRTTGMQDIAASKQSILNQILDIPNYVGKAPKLKSCSIYYKKESDDKLIIKTKMTADVIFGYTVSIYFFPKICIIT